MVQLRPYQKTQLSFLSDHLSVADTVALESPTGSGKTFVALALAEQWLKDHPLSNVLISTGFNHLVFLMERRAKEMGLDPLVLIGTGALNCPKLWEDRGHKEPFRFFDNERSCVCGTLHHHLDTTSLEGEKNCPFTVDAYRGLLNKIQNDCGHVIICNHSTLLAHQSLETWSNTSLWVIDEAHTFASFYSSWANLELDHDDLMKIDKALAKMPQPWGGVIKRNIQNVKKLPKQQVDRLVDAVPGRGFKQRVKEFFETEASLNNFIEHDGNSMLIHRFYRQFEIHGQPKTVLMSATCDRFTLNMFRVRPEHVYRERRTFVDYAKSEFVAIPREQFLDGFHELLQYVDRKGLTKGLCLSTTIADMRSALEQDGYLDFHMTSDLQEFIKSPVGQKIVLCGSRALFQGIDIPDLQFVSLNRIPFPNWNDCAKAEQDYLSNFGRNNFDPWKDFVVPKTENDMIQATGRLWRDSESLGVVSIFDDRIERFKYMAKDAFVRARPGIGVKMIKERGGQAECWKL